MARRVAGRRHAADAAVAKQVVLAVDEAPRVAEVVVARVVVVAGAQVGIGGGLPLATLHHERRVRELRVAADVVEVQVRVHQPRDALGIDALRAQSCGQFLTAREVDAIELREEAESSLCVRLGFEMQAGVEDQRAGRMQHQPAGYGNADLAGLAFEEEPEVCLDPAAGEREESDRHGRGR
jgi:hypothetical protein